MARLSLEVNGKVTSGKGVVASYLNNYFTTVAKNLEARLPDHSGVFNEEQMQVHYSQYGLQNGSFSFNEVLEGKVQNRLKELGAS